MCVLDRFKQKTHLDWNGYILEVPPFFERVVFSFITHAWTV